MPFTAVYDDGSRVWVDEGVVVDVVVTVLGVRVEVVVDARLVETVVEEEIVVDELTGI